MVVTEHPQTGQVGEASAWQRGKQAHATLDGLLQGKHSHFLYSQGPPRTHISAVCPGDTTFPWGHADKEESLPSQSSPHRRQALPACESPGEIWVGGAFRMLRDSAGHGQP